VGDGARTKLVNNLLAGINLVGAAEALALAERMGLDAKRTLQVMAASSAQSWIADDRMPRALLGDYCPGHTLTDCWKNTRLAGRTAPPVTLALADLWGLHRPRRLPEQAPLDWRGFRRCRSVDLFEVPLHNRNMISREPTLRATDHRRKTCSSNLIGLDESHSSRALSAVPRPTKSMKR
jgi:hypothetical protein